MSSKTKKSKPRSQKLAVERAKAVPRESKPPGRAPEATVVSRHGAGMVARGGKGYSPGEVAAASLPARFARAWGLPTDSRRRSVLEANVQSLRKWYSVPARETAVPVVAAAAPAKAPETPERRPKKRAVRKKKSEA